ncbi:hypothetical protein GCM10007940_28310 [Portibacter lacus]|uniref:Uncharacterized protein n=1 Tax=Portibacter lacus TaxID=1099794 RepID=A0AA37ST46_9BACT|nr:hypothetical protein GCM10007940_28310 [Portibacter lacus]
MIHVFKTSVQTAEDIKKLKPKLDKLSPNLKWNFDLEDCDKILRIEDFNISPISIIDLLVELNFECKELE